MAKAQRAFVRTPCETCPYRMDARRFHWDRAEFEGVLAAEQEMFGRIYNCHKQAELPKERQGFCAGWLLDQKKRNVPSIALRLALWKDASAVAALKAVTAGGLKLFRSVAAMCRANGVTKAPASAFKSERRQDVEAIGRRLRDDMKASQ